ncbi:50S ribosomal protein L3 [Thalassoglobus sp.]|uniref:50S ribosomal protein L3 n=1 Tax=Thalassoglobus sp. TaxID=2795869 RepID=UPI003AA9C2B5
MPLGLLGKKVGMTQVYDDDGVAVPVTVIEAGPCVVLQLKTVERDGYEGVQLGYDDKLSDKDKDREESQRKRSRANRAERGHVAQLKSKRQQRLSEAGVESSPKAGCEPKRVVREFRIDGEGREYEIGQELTVAVLDEVKKVDVTATSKGRGTAGVMKRHNFQGQRATHGVKKVHRKAGGIGAATDPARVWKGKRMAGQYGNKRATIRSLKVVSVDVENNVLLVKGAIPGPNGGYVIIRAAK